MRMHTGEHNQSRKNVTCRHLKKKNDCVLSTSPCQKLLTAGKRFFSPSSSASAAVRHVFDVQLVEDTCNCFHHACTCACAQRTVGDGTFIVSLTSLTTQTEAAFHSAASVLRHVLALQDERNHQFVHFIPVLVTAPFPFDGPKFSATSKNPSPCFSNEPHATDIMWRNS